MEYNYVLQNGSVKETETGLLFSGKQVESIDPNTNEAKQFPLFSAILFPVSFIAGKLSFDVEFSDVCALTRCGFTFSRTFVDGIERFYQIVIRNQAGFCSLDYYNGSAWEFLCEYGGSGRLEKHKKYKLELSLFGNNLSFSINGVPMLNYTKLRVDDGVCGIFTYNEADSVINNIHVKVEKPTAFAIMKYEKDFDELYQEVIVHVCKDYGYSCHRADEFYTSSAIIQDIIKEIANASLIIADITMDNPNVFYELGYAHALHKPTILLADKGKRDRLPFDISGYRTIFYENTIGGKKEIENLLCKYIENIRA